MKTTALPVHVGKRYGRLIAIARRPNDAGQNQVWLWRCDCGAEFEGRVSNVLYGLRTVDWASCKVCYEAAGGFEGLRRRKGEP